MYFMKMIYKNNQEMCIIKSDYILSDHTIIKHI